MKITEIKEIAKQYNLKTGKSKSLLPLEVWIKRPVPQMENK